MWNKTFVLLQSFGKAENVLKNKPLHYLPDRSITKVVG